MNGNPTANGKNDVHAVWPDRGHVGVYEPRAGQELNQLDSTPAALSIYSLGVLLYELLVGTTPFDPQTYDDWTAGLNNELRWQTGTLSHIGDHGSQSRLCCLSLACRSATQLIWVRLDNAKPRLAHVTAGETTETCIVVSYSGWR